MSVTVGFAGVAILFVLLALRVPVAIGLIGVSFGGVAWMLGLTLAIGIVSNTPFSFIANWTLSAVPMFLLMGFISYHAGLTAGLFEVAKAVLRRVLGALAISSIFARSGFAAVCGSSLATAAAMGRIAIPEMVRSGYSPSFATGAIAAGGTIGALIPPSILMIVYGVFAETLITQVFVGGITIGLVTALSYSVIVLLTTWLRPDIAPPRPLDAGGLNTAEALLNIWPVLLLMGMVFGGLFSGVFTATEAGAVGALGSILIGIGTRRLNWAIFRVSMIETLQTSASLFIIGIGAAMFTRFLGLMGLSGFLSQFVAGADLGSVQLMLIVVVIYLVLGMFMEPFGAMMVTLPVLLPIFRQAHINLVWFGVLLVKLLEIGMITPPVGMNVFVIRNVASQYASVTQIFKGVIPFLLADLVPTLASGERTATICISEPGAGSDVGCIRTRAVRQEDGSWRISGQKIRISFGDHDMRARIGHCLLARTGDAPGTRGLSLFLVENTEGVRCERIEEKMGLHGSPTCAMLFDNAPGQLIGEEGRGLPQMFSMIRHMRLSVACQGLGTALRAYSVAAEHAAERRQGGNPKEPPVAIIEHADVRRQLIDMKSRIDLFRLALLETACAADLSDQDETLARFTAWMLPLIKNFGAELAFDVAGKAILVLGGSGYTRDYPVEQALRDSRVFAI